MKYKVGDQVRVKTLAELENSDWYQEADDAWEHIDDIGGTAFTDSMYKFCGESFTILAVKQDCYHLELEEFWFTDEMLIPISPLETIIREIKEEIYGS